MVVIANVKNIKKKTPKSQKSLYDAGRLTSFSRLTRTCSGLSDMMNSQVVSADGALLPLSGAYWIFLMANRTELLQKDMSTLCKELESGS